MCICGLDIGLKWLCLQLSTSVFNILWFHTQWGTSLHYKQNYRNWTFALRLVSTPILNRVEGTYIENVCENVCESALLGGGIFEKTDKLENRVYSSTEHPYLFSFILHVSVDTHARCWIHNWYQWHELLFTRLTRFNHQQLARMRTWIFHRRLSHLLEFSLTDGVENGGFDESSFDNHPKWKRSILFTLLKAYTGYLDELIVFHWLI